MNWQEILLPLGLALIAAVPGVLAWQRQSRRDKADAASTLTGSALEMVQAYKAELAAVKAESEREMDRLRQRLQELEARVTKLELEKKELITGASLLTNQIYGLRSRPIWSLDKFEKTGDGMRQPE